MPSTFLGIQIGQSGLAAAQLGQDVTGQNVANAGTPGYSVQSVDQQAADPLSIPDLADSVHAGQIGTGVVTGSITRARDQFLDVQVRDAVSQQSMDTATQNALTQVQSAFNEPSDNGLNSAMSAFFNGFNSLTNNPENLGVRTTVIQSGSALAQHFQSLQSTLDAQNGQISSKINTDIGTLNGDASQIAALNVSIRQVTAQGQHPNDLMDKRDALLDNLASLANITVTQQANGTVNVAIGTSDLVVGTDANTLTLSGLQSRNDLQGGELGGLVQAQADLSGYQSNLDDLAATTIATVNAQHEAGVDLKGAAGGAFFTGTDARSIAVSTALVNDPSKLAAAAAPVPPATAAPGDATNAVALANLQNTTLTAGSLVKPALVGQTLQSFYQGIVTDAGAKGAAAQTAANDATANVNQLTQQRNSVSGVSTDTELTNMMKYQRAYQASAQVVKTMDDMLGTLINNIFSAS